jgi:hypothetical protein
MFQSLSSASNGHSFQIKSKITKMAVILKLVKNWIQFYNGIINTLNNVT